MGALRYFAQLLPCSKTSVLRWWIHVHENAAGVRDGDGNHVGRTRGEAFDLWVVEGIVKIVLMTYVSVQFSSVAQSCLALCDSMNRCTPGLPVHHQLPEFTQTHVHQVGDAIQPSHPLLSPSPSALNLSQHQGLFKWVSSSHQVAKVLEFQPQHQSFQWIPRTDLL